MTKKLTKNDPRAVAQDRHEQMMAGAHQSARHMMRFDKVPAGFVRNRRKTSPFAETALVELVIRTAEGLGFAGPRKVHPEEWSTPADELGSIAAYRLVDSQA